MHCSLKYVKIHTHNNIDTVYTHHLLPIQKECLQIAKFIPHTLQSYPAKSRYSRSDTSGCAWLSRVVSGTISGSILSKTNAAQGCRVYLAFVIVVFREDLSL